MLDSDTEDDVCNNILFSYFRYVELLMLLSQILPVIFLYFLQNKWIVLLNVKCPGKCCSTLLLHPSVPNSAELSPARENIAEV